MQIERFSGNIIGFVHAGPAHGLLFQSLDNEVSYAHPAVLPGVHIRCDFNAPRQIFCKLAGLEFDDSRFLPIKNAGSLLLPLPLLVDELKSDRFDVDGRHLDHVHDPRGLQFERQEELFPKILEHEPLVRLLAQVRKIATSKHVGFGVLDSVLQVYGAHILYQTQATPEVSIYDMKNM